MKKAKGRIEATPLPPILFQRGWSNEVFGADSNSMGQKGTTKGRRLFDPSILTFKGATARGRFSGFRRLVVLDSHRQLPTEHRVLVR